MPDRMPEDILNRVLEDMLNRMPEDLLDRIPEDMLENIPDHMLEDMPDRMSNRMSEDILDRMSEDLPVRKCINVMVGITRNKVFFFGAGNANIDCFLQEVYLVYCFPQEVSWAAAFKERRKLNSEDQNFLKLPVHVIHYEEIHI